MRIAWPGPVSSSAEIASGWNATTRLPPTTGWAPRIACGS